MASLGTICDICDYWWQHGDNASSKRIDDELFRLQNLPAGRINEAHCGGRLIDFAPNSQLNILFRERHQLGLDWNPTQTCCPLVRAIYLLSPSDCIMLIKELDPDRVDCTSSAGRTPLYAACLTVIHHEHPMTIVDELLRRIELVNPNAACFQKNPIELITVSGDRWQRIQPVCDRLAGARVKRQVYETQLDRSLHQLLHCLPSVLIPFIVGYMF